MLEIDHVSFAYADAHGHALTDVTLTVNPGERVVVLGANGSGKSTLARVANGSARPLSGSVRVDGEKDGALVRRVGYVRQDPTSQLVSARVFDEVAFGPANLGLTRQEVVSRANEALERCRIEKLADRGTAGLSGGQQQLVAIAGVVAMRPRYLVLDEICSHLDPLARSEVEGLVDSLVSDGVGVLEMAHDVRSVLCATRVVVLDGGCVVWEGTPGELLGPENTPRTALLDDDPCARAISVAARAGADISACADPDALAAFAGAQGLESEVLEALGSREAAAATLAGHVLLVEDDVVSREVGIDLLQMLGVSVTAVENGQLAVEAVQAKDFDLVLMDLEMPVLDGIAATRAIRTLPRGAFLPIIAQTASAFADTRERCLAAGMNGFLSKPIVVSRLRELLTEYLGVDPAIAPPPINTSTLTQAELRIALDRWQTQLEVGNVEANHSFYQLKTSLQLLDATITQQVEQHLSVYDYDSILPLLAELRRKLADETANDMP